MTGNRHDYRVTEKGIVYEETLMDRLVDFFTDAYSWLFRRNGRASR